MWVPVITCREQPTGPFSIGRSDLDPLAGGMGSGMIFDPMRTGFPSYGGRGTGGPNILPRYDICEDVPLCKF